MYLADHHLHSKFSFDSDEDIDNICISAVNKGINEIAFTDHMDMYTNKNFESILDCKGMYDAVMNAKEKYSDRLKIKVGVELGQPQANPYETERFYKSFDFDFIIGSVHNLENDVDAGDFDFIHNDCNHLYSHYLDHLLILAQNFDYDVLGHLTYPLRYMFIRNSITVDLIQFTEKFKKLFEIVIEKGKGIEINTSGLRQGLNNTLPPLYIVKLYKKCGGEVITVGSDAHNAFDVGSGLKEGYEILKEAGFKYFSVFNERKPDFISL